MLAAMTKAFNSADLLNRDVIYIAGGAKVYKGAEKYIDQYIVTHISATDKDADTFYKIPDGYDYMGDIVKTTKSSSGLNFKVSKYEKEDCVNV